MASGPSSSSSSASKISIIGASSMIAARAAASRPVRCAGCVQSALARRAPRASGVPLRSAWITTRITSSSSATSVRSAERAQRALTAVAHRQLLHHQPQLVAQRIDRCDQAAMRRAPATGEIEPGVEREREQIEGARAAGARSFGRGRACDRAARAAATLHRALQRPRPTTRPIGWQARALARCPRRRRARTARAARRHTNRGSSRCAGAALRAAAQRCDGELSAARAEPASCGLEVAKYAPDSAARRCSPRRPSSGRGSGDSCTRTHDGRCERERAEREIAVV